MTHNHLYHSNLWFIAILSVLVYLTSCSTTRHLPEGDLLYIGVEDIEVNMQDTVDEAVREIVASTLEVQPNSALLGSAYKRSPFPIGLWAYNAFYTEKTSGFKHWLWSILKSDPILVSQVNPMLRCHATELALADEGYFGAKVVYDTVYHFRDSLKAKLSYQVDCPRASRLTSIQYMPTSSIVIDTLLGQTTDQSFLKEGNRFCATDLENEKKRINTLLHEQGYYYYRPEYIQFLADSSQTEKEIALRVYLDRELSSKHILKPCVIDSLSFNLDYGMGRESNQTDNAAFGTIAYRGRLSIKPKYLRAMIPFDSSAVYHPSYANLLKKKINRLNTFRYTSVNYQLRSDSTINQSDTSHLVMNVNATYDYPWNGMLEFKALAKDNHQVGPGMEITVQRRNCFGGGELLSAELTAGYEWLTGKRTYTGNHNLLNSYEFGMKTSFNIPRLQLPPILRVDSDYPVSTTYTLSANIMRRSGFFQMFKGSGEIRYDFYTNDVSSHSITPFKLTYTSMMETSHKFDSIIAGNRVLKQSFENQFIPAIEYTYLYDNRTVMGGRLSQQWLQVTISEAGGILNGIMSWVGSRPKGERQLLWQPFSQYIKATVDFRNYFTLSPRLTLASRLLGGIAYAYGNSSVVPYSEQFYIGGANSLRGFSIRSLGPGNFTPTGNRYGYMDQTGDLKLEANIELRFPIIGDLQGALFADAGNIWTIRNNQERPDGQFEMKHLLKDLATDIGIGLRYDLGMLVVRFDVGVPIHDPSEKDSKYYNIDGSFFGNLGYHLAVGYPF